MAHKRFYKTKSHFDRNVYITFLVFFLVALTLLSFKINSSVDCSDVGFEVVSESYTVEDLIEFKSTDISGVEWQWNFGDSTATAHRSDVVHRFAQPGKYTISLRMNGQCMATKDIVIEKQRIRKDPELIPNIILPKYVRVGDQVEFANDSKFAKEWQWSFGETTDIDGRDRVVQYTYKQPGEKTVLLVVNDDRLHEAKQRITVLPVEKKRKARNIMRRTDPIETVLRQQIIDKPIAESRKEEKEKRRKEAEKINRIDVSEHQLQQLCADYSNRRIDDTTIRNYFCYSNIPVFNKTGDRFTVSEFFNTIRDVKLELNGIKLVRDKKTGCVKSMTVDMRTRKGLFWKKF
ncbi:PKD domain-containing protein [Pricia sp. S334]|uniref:PKD domain-containing protein n=1 Tax=Pricia mediterranea TaxID=3076079 RepID=A0ABU3LA89_9FLAO|nr:PKD domain-containing protein [Pricia sp. S334]MDT7830629.1 PKD domain-containing protein [Pricia sp. S334]